MKVHIVTGGEFDTMLMKGLLEEPSADSSSVTLMFYTANGKNAARPLARQVQRATHQPVVFVAASDDPDQQRSQEQQRSYESYFRWSSDEVPFHVALMVPGIEVLFFRNLRLVSHLFGKELEQHVEELARLAPKQALNRLLENQQPNLEEFVDRLDENDLVLLREETEVRDIREFLTEMAAIEPALR